MIIMINEGCDYDLVKYITSDEHKYSFGEFTNIENVSCFHIDGVCLLRIGYDYDTLEIMA